MPAFHSTQNTHHSSPSVMEKAAEREAEPARSRRPGNMSLAGHVPRAQWHPQAPSGLRGFALWSVTRAAGCLGGRQDRLSGNVSTGVGWREWTCGKRAAWLSDGGGLALGGRAEAAICGSDWTGVQGRMEAYPHHLELLLIQKQYSLGLSPPLCAMQIHWNSRPGRCPWWERQPSRLGSSLRPKQIIRLGILTDERARRQFAGGARYWRTRATIELSSIKPPPPTTLSSSS
jgi:hypothetical protein